MIFIGADHRGFQLKEQLRDHLKQKGYELADMGAYSEESTDYPLIAAAVARKVQEGPEHRGIVICGSSAGVCIVANKFKGIRAADAWKPEVARAARNDDDVNVLCLSADHLAFDQAVEIVDHFLTTKFGRQERYLRRLKQIKEVEDGN